MDPVAQPQRKMFYRTPPWHQVRSGDLPGEWRYDDGSVVPRTQWPSRERVMAGMVNKPWPPTPVAAPPPRTSAATVPPPRPAIVQPPVPYSHPAAVFNSQATLPRSQSTTSMPATAAAPAYRLGDVVRPGALPNGMALRHASYSLPTMLSVVRQPTTGVAPSPPSAFRPNSDARDAVTSLLTAAPPQRATALAAMPQAPPFNAGPQTTRSRFAGTPSIAPPAAIDVPGRRVVGTKYRTPHLAAGTMSPVPEWTTRQQTSGAPSTPLPLPPPSAYTTRENTLSPPKPPQTAPALTDLAWPTPRDFWSKQPPQNAHIALANAMQSYGSDALGRAMGLLYGSIPDLPRQRFTPVNQQPLLEFSSANPRSSRANQAVTEWNRQAGLSDLVPVDIAPLQGAAGQYSARDKRITLDPAYQNDALTLTHEMYHADQDRRFGTFAHRGSISDISAKVPKSEWGPLRNQMSASIAAGEFTPTLLEQMVPYHVTKMEPRRVMSSRAADEVMRDILTSGVGNAPVGYLPGPNGLAVPFSTLEQQAARYGAFGPTPRAKKLGYTGTTRRPIEELLNTPEGKAWLRRYMTAGIGE
jgi:hypothetical protein